MRAVESPNLPESRVGLLAAGERYRGVLEEPLSSLIPEILWLPDNKNVDPRLSGHADLSMLHLGGETVVSALLSGDIVNKLTYYGFNVIGAQDRQSPVFPHDCGLNACIIGEKLFHRLSVTDRAAKRLMPDDLTMTDVPQAYAKCSVCVVDERSIITSDKGIAKITALHGIETLLIEQGFISLPGFESGFIGGSAFKISARELAFTGSIDGMPDRDRMLAFLESRNVRPVFLTDHQIFDIGSALPLMTA